MGWDDSSPAEMATMEAIHKGIEAPAVAPPARSP